MAIEPKVVYAEGSVGSEDTWVRDEEGMRPITVSYTHLTLPTSRSV